MRKNLGLLLVLILCISSANTQILNTTNPGAQFSESINKVVSDFRNNFYNIQGEALPAEGEMDVFRSTVLLHGSINTVIYRFHSTIDTTASWQAMMFQGESYAEAVKVYRNTSRLLNKCRIAFPGYNAVGFSGKFNDPEPNIAFASSSFKLNVDNATYKDFYAEIEMLNTGFDSWEVRLNLHSKKDDTDK